MKNVKVDTIVRTIVLVIALANQILAIAGKDRKSTRLNSSHRSQSRMPSSA